MHISFEQGLCKHTYKNIFLTFSCRLLLHSKQVNDRSLRSLKSLSRHLLNYEDLQIAANPVLPISTSLLNVLRIAREDHTSQVFNPIYTKNSQEEVWGSFTRQQQLILDGIKILASQEQDNPSNINLCTLVEVVHGRMMMVNREYGDPRTRWKGVMAKLQCVEAVQADLQHAFHMAYFATTREYPEVCSLYAYDCS